MKTIIKNSLNERVKSVIRSSTIYQHLYNNTHARSLANSGKRLDICANEVAIYLLCCSQEKYAIRDKVCLEIGSGWLLTHALTFYLLGAKKIYATDVEYLLNPKYISQAIENSVNWSILDSLSMFEDRNAVKSRLNQLLAVKRFSIERLKDFGIEYIAPSDLSKTVPILDKIDFIFSKSVLEHVPADDISRLLKNLTDSLSCNGCMFHLIHLVDHKDMTNKPFDFLTYSPEFYSRELQSRWGNRIRASQWKQIFSEIQNLNFRFVFEWLCEDKKLPEKIDSSIQYNDENDLRISHIGVFAQKVNG